LCKKAIPRVEVHLKFSDQLIEASGGQRILVTKVSLYLLNLRKTTDLLIPNMTTFCEKDFYPY
jgi:hypothetical protein